MDLKGKQVSNYRIRELLGEGGMSYVYLAQDENNNREVALKLLKTGVTSSYIEDVIRFKRELEIVSKLEHNNIIKVYDSGNFETEHNVSMPYIVMELIKGQELSDILKSKERIKIDAALNIIRQLAEALEYVHGFGLLHRDLKPGNILLHEDSESKNSKVVKLLDFGLSQVMELKEIKGEKEVLGTFGYMSPEATGILNKRIDERSDLYSLGIIFYQLLTNELPFKGVDTSAIIHQQVAKTPNPPRLVSKDVPEVVNDMIMKLLSKEPELRYQSARGLLHDLKKYECKEKFIIGENDQKVKISFQTRLVGRDEELNSLKKSLRDAYDGRGGITFISGDAGVGKSRLIEELKNYCFDLGGEFLVGRCYSQENKMPYNPFRDVLDGYTRFVENMENVPKRDEIKRIKNELGDLGEVIVRLNSNVRAILGETKPLVPLKGERENQRFLMVASKFICSLGIKQRPFILYLDDLQWGDEGSFGLLQEIADKIADSSILVIGTYRHREVSDEQTLSKLIKNLRSSDNRPEEMHLDIFDEDKLCKLTANILGEKEEHAKQINRYIHKKSSGNPFFAINVIRELVEEKAIEWKNGRWIEDWERIENIRMPDNIIDMILKRVENLSEKQEKLLMTASVISREFEIQMLYGLLPYSEEEIIRLVDEAIDKQLLEQSLERGKVIFVHVRIRDGFFNKMSADYLKDMHIQIARMIEKENKNNIDDVLFDLSHHYVEGGDENKALEYLVPAADKAKKAFANDDAIQYYQIAIEYFEKNGRENTPDCLNAKESLSEVYLTTGMSDDSIKLSQELLPLKTELLDKARVYKRIGTAYFKKGAWQQCEDSFAAGLLFLGVKIPRKKSEDIPYLLREFLIHILHNLFPWMFYLSDGRKSDPKEREIISFLIPAGWMFMLSNAKRGVWTILKMLNISQSKIGKSKELGTALSSYGVICANIHLFSRCYKYSETALKMRRELKDEWGIAQSLQLFGYASYWNADYLKSIDMFKESIAKFQQMGDMWELGMALNGLGIVYKQIGRFEDASRCFFQYLEVSKKIKDDHGISSAYGVLVRNYLEAGDFEKAEDYGKKALALSDTIENQHISCSLNMHLGSLKLEIGDYDKSLKYLEHAKYLYENNTFIEEPTSYFYSLLEDAYIERYQNTDIKKDPVEGKKELKKIGGIAKVGLKKTKPWPNHYGRMLRINAKYYAITGETRKAHRNFKLSIKKTGQLGIKPDEGKGCYEYGRFLFSIGKEKEAREQWEKAYNIFTEIGARAYAGRTAEFLGISADENPADKKKEDVSSAQIRLTDRRELASVIDASHHLSSILSLDELLEKIMDISIEVSGAERGYLFLYPENKQAARELEIVISRNVDKDEFKKEGFAVSRTLIKKVEEEKQAKLIIDAGNEQDLKQQASVVRYGLRSIMCVPLIVRDKMLGLVYLDNRLVAGLFSKEKLELLKTIIVQASISIENATLVKNMVEQERLKREMQLGRELQMNLVPREAPEVRGLQLAGFMQPAKEIGGDYYDFIENDDGNLDIVIGDVSGKGLGAGMIMSSAKAILQTLSHQRMNTKESMVVLNKVLLKYTKLQYMMTMLLFKWNPDSGKMAYTGAGHEEIIIYRKNGEVESIVGGGLVLGMLPDLEKNLEEKELKVKEGDKVVLYTDGVIEAKNSKNEFYLLKRLIESVKEYGKGSPEDILSGIKKDLDSFIGEREQYDDITMVIMEVKRR